MRISIFGLGLLMSMNSFAAFKADDRLISMLSPKVDAYISNMPPRGDPDLALQASREYLELLAKNAPTRDQDIEVCIIPFQSKYGQSVCTSRIIKYSLDSWKELVTIAPKKSLDFADFITQEYPHSTYASDAQLVSAAAAQLLGRTDASTKIFQDFLTVHPDECSQEVADALVSLIATSGATPAILSEVEHYLGACAESEKQPSSEKYIAHRRTDAAAEIVAIKSIASRTVQNGGSEFTTHYFRVRQLQKQLLGSKLREDRDELIRILRELLTIAPSDDWKAYVQFLIGNTESKTEANGPWIAMEPNEDAISAFEVVIEKYPRARFPVTDPFFWVTEGQPIAAQTHLKLARAFEVDAKSFENGPQGWTAQVERFRQINQPGFDRAVAEYEVIVRDYGSPTIIDEKGSSVLGDAYIGLLRLYQEYGPIRVNTERTQKCIEQNCPYMPPPNANAVFSGINAAPFEIKINELNKLFATQFPNMPFLWNGWWFGATRPEAYLALAKQEKDPTKKVPYLLKAITENPNSWYGKVGSGDVGRYDKDAFAVLMREAPNDEEAIKFCDEVIASNAHQELKDVAKNKILELRLHANAASIFKKPVEKKVAFGACGYTYYYDGAKISNKDFEGFLKYSPVQWRPMFGNQEQFENLQEAMATLPPEIKPLLECYASEVSKRQQYCQAIDLWTAFLKGSGIVEIKGICDDSD